MAFLWWILLGLVAGVVAKFLMPGKDPGGIVMTIVLGILGAVVGGYLGTLAGLGDVNGFDLKSIALAAGGAMLLLLGYNFMQRKA